MDKKQRPSSYVAKALGGLDDIDFSDGTVYNRFDNGISELGNNLCLSTLIKVEKALSDHQHHLVLLEESDEKAIQNLGNLALTCKAIIKALSRENL